MNYGFADIEDGLVFIYFKELKKGGFELVYWDNGIGLPENFDLENPQTFGFRLIKVLIDGLDAKLDVKSLNGLKFKINF